MNKLLLTHHSRVHVYKMATTPSGFLQHCLTSTPDIPLPPDYLLFQEIAAIKHY